MGMDEESGSAKSAGNLCLDLDRQISETCGVHDDDGWMIKEFERNTPSRG